MNKRKFKNETEGQIEFFKNYKIPYEGENSALIDSTDGIYKGNIFEFKLNIDNLGKVLFQAIKYLSRERVRGQSIPSNILLVSLDKTLVYVYHSQDYFDEIHQVYSGASSRNNDDFVADTKYFKKLDYSNSLDSSELVKILNEEKFMPIKIDENCIVGWANRYYKEKPTASKGDFIGDDEIKIKIKGEIREPKHFKGLILPYEGETNEKFKYLMDCLNDRLNKIELGAYYTPAPYCKKAAELVKMATDRVPDGNDYIILDRCAGTGNLEEALEGTYDKNGSELISHCVVSTYEYYEYRVLFERLLGKVREIIPPSEENVVYSNGMVSNADAMSKAFIDNPIIKQYLDDPKCSIIMFENPPFSDVAGNSEYKAKRNEWKKSYVSNEMKKFVKGVSSNDSANAFIWSAFKFYLRQLTDFYIVFSPIKYWKSGHIINKEILKSYVFNKKYFHAKSKIAIVCNLFSNRNVDISNFPATVWDIDNNKTIFVAQMNIKRVYHCFSEANDKRKFDNDLSIDFVLGKNGYIKTGIKSSIKPITNSNIIGYLLCCGFAFVKPSQQTQLTRLGYYGGHGYYLRQDNYIEKLPLFVAGWYYDFANWMRKTLFLEV